MPSSRPEAPTIPCPFFSYARESPKDTANQPPQESRLADFLLRHGQIWIENLRRHGGSCHQESQRHGVIGAGAGCRQTGISLRPAEPNLLVEHALREFACAGELAGAASEHRAAAGRDIEA